MLRWQHSDPPPPQKKKIVHFLVLFSTMKNKEQPGELTKIILTLEKLNTLTVESLFATPNCCFVTRKHSTRSTLVHWENTQARLWPGSTNNEPASHPFWGYSANSRQKRRSFFHGKICFRAKIQWIARLLLPCLRYPKQNLKQLSYQLLLSEFNLKQYVHPPNHCQ